MGVSGGLIDAEVMYTATIGQNYRHKQVKTRLSMKPTYTTTLGLTVPVVSKIGNHQPQTNEPPRTEISGGLGDVSLDLSKAFGMSGQYSLSFALTMPTGQYDIKRGTDNQKQFLSSSLQKGGGLWAPSVTLSYSKDVIDGIWLFDAGYSHPMALNFKGKNQYITSDEDAEDRFVNLSKDFEYMDEEQKERYEYVFKPYGENDLGAYTPPSVNASVYFGYRGIDHYVHSWGVTFSAPLGVAWIPGFSASEYNPFPDPDHKAWNASLNYGLEWSRHKFPIFFAVSLPISDKANEPDSQDRYNEEPFKKWDGPDWSDLRQSWTVGVGMKATMF
ncbi:MAG: hypothetical protein GF363_05435 [Chitinivibrionales bacterium]|nr:hypothetical protein [Chitinivibrionales bacterium]